MNARQATPAETVAAPARGFLDACETFADEASSSAVDAASIDRFRAEARKAAARSASDAARLGASEQAAPRARIARDRAERERRQLAEQRGDRKERQQRHSLRLPCGALLRRSAP